MSNLPRGWRTCQFTEVCELNPSRQTTNLELTTPVTFVPMASVDATSGAISSPIIRPYSEVAKGFTPFRENDVIMAKITPCMENGKAAIARHLMNGFGFGSTEFHVFRSGSAIIPQYFFHFIRQKSFRKLAEANMTGSVGQKRVPTTFLKESIIPLPPLKEQKRIVEKLEKLLGKVEAVQARLDKIPAILKRFRQAVLTVACLGKLTIDWRVKNTHLKTAIHYLNQINLEREEQYKENLQLAKFKKTEKPRRPNYLNYNTYNCKFDDSLPKSWIVAPVGLLCDCIVPGRDKPKSFTGSIVWITLPNIINSEIQEGMNQLKLSESEISEVKAKIIPIDSVIMSCIGRFGISAIVKEPVVINQQLHAYLKSEKI